MLRTHGPGDSFGLGDTQVSYIFNDEAGNEATCVFTVSVLGKSQHKDFHGYRLGLSCSLYISSAACISAMISFSSMLSNVHLCNKSSLSCISALANI